MQSENGIILRTCGWSPVVITVRHDGRMISLGGKELPIRHPDRCNDEGTAYLVLQILDNLFASLSASLPYALFQGVERRRLSRAMTMELYHETLFAVKRSLGLFGKCYLLDIHAFAEQPAIGNFDIILGTNHRRTIMQNFDLQFAAALQKAAFLRGYDENFRIYIPDNEPREGEEFGATKNMTFVKWIKDREPEVNAIQAEIYKDWFVKEETMDNLARVFSDVLRTLI